MSLYVPVDPKFIELTSAKYGLNPFEIYKNKLVITLRGRMANIIYIDLPIVLLVEREKQTKTARQDSVTKQLHNGHQTFGRSTARLCVSLLDILICFEPQSR